MNLAHLDMSSAVSVVERHSLRGVTRAGLVATDVIGGPAGPPFDPICFRQPGVGGRVIGVEGDGPFEQTRGFGDAFLPVPIDQLSRVQDVIKGRQALGWFAFHTIDAQFAKPPRKRGDHRLGDIILDGEDVL